MSTEWPCWKLTQNKKPSAWACSCVPSAKRKSADNLVRTSTLLINSVISTCGCIFSVSFWHVSSSVKVSKFSRLANERKTFSSVSCVLASLAGDVTNARVASAWLQRPFAPLLLLASTLLSEEDDCHETFRSLCGQHSTVNKGRVKRSLQTTVLPEMRSNSPCQVAAVATS